MKDVRKNKKVKLKNIKIGILGGMGPQASSELLRLIISKAISRFGAKECDEFPEIVLDSIPVEDFISNTDKVKRVRKMIVNRALNLKSMGCNPIVLACNSAHVMESDIKKAIGKKFRSLISIMGQEAKKRGMKKVCVFATPTTINNDLYKVGFQSLDISVIYPNKRIITMHENIIRRVISGKNNKVDRSRILNLAKRIIKAGQADGVILGCTELPVAAGETNNPKILSSLSVLADNLLGEYYTSKILV